MTHPQDNPKTLARKVVVTDRLLRGLKPAPPGQRLVIWDAVVPGLSIRVTDNGATSFSVLRRIKGQLGPIRVTIGVTWQVPHPPSAKLPYALSDAREDARKIILAMSRGDDPRVARVVKEPRNDTFGIVAKIFLDRHVSKLKSSHEVEMAFKRELLPMLGTKPIATITRRDIVQLIEAVAAERPHTAKQLFAYLNKFFSFAIERNIYDIAASPCMGVKISNIIGPIASRDHVLTNSELRTVWHAADGLVYPAGPFIKLLILTGQRLREIAGLKWTEIDLVAGLVTLAGDRMKTGVASEIPLAAASVELLKGLPRWSGPHIFTSRGGHLPIAGFSQLKKKLDAATPGLAPWRFHDLRRTMRTGMGALPIPSNICELCIGHSQPGLHKIYDRHSYRAEKLMAFELWSARVKEIVS